MQHFQTVPSLCKITISFYVCCEIISLNLFLQFYVLKAHHFAEVSKMACVHLEGTFVTPQLAYVLNCTINDVAFSHCPQVAHTATNQALKHKYVSLHLQCLQWPYELFGLPPYELDWHLPYL